MSNQPVSIHQIAAQFGTDSGNYEVLTDAAIRSKGVERYWEIDGRTLLE